MTNRPLHPPFLVFGEIVWDVFPDGKCLGGAPLNFAYYFSKAGGSPLVISAVGRDALGEEALRKIASLGLDCSGIRTDARDTGIVRIVKDGGRHKFIIVRGTAWECLVFPENDEVYDQSSGLYVGTLTRVSEGNRRLSNRLIERFSDKTVFLDVNLRRNCYSAKDTAFLLERVTHVKMNHTEADILKGMGLLTAGSYESMAEELALRPNVRACCITLGPKGAIGADCKSGAVRVRGIPAKRGGDSVGTGDAFGAFWLHSLLKGRGMEESLAEANRIGAAVASVKGALLE
jgi:fructokinase